MNKKESCLKRIEKALTHLVVQVELRNSLNLYDVNIIAENFYRDFLNRLFPEANFKNLNRIDKNATAIDLIDENAKISYQITSNSKADKIHNTIQKFIKNGYYEKYKELKILIITSKKNYTTDFTTKEGSWSFDNNDILDIKDLFGIIGDFNSARLEEVANFLDEEVLFHLKDTSKIDSNELETIIAMIEVLSNPANTNISDVAEDYPDPEKKIYKRFSDYSEFLIKSYTELHSIYNAELTEADDKINTDSVSKKKRQLYLKFKSDELLNQHDLNPQKALEELTRFFEGKIQSRCKNYDYSAIKFFLLDELIKCNVFPN